MVIYPFSRDLVSKFENENSHLTITGQFITEFFKIGITEDGKADFEFDSESANPQVFKPDYLMRVRLEDLSRNAFSFLHIENNRTLNEILVGLDVLRTFIWNRFDDIKSYSDEPDLYSTGFQAFENNAHSFRAWLAYSDPDMTLECMGDDWLSSSLWNVEKNWSWQEIYALLSLWSIDEATTYLNNGLFFKSLIWFERALTNYYFYSIIPDDKSSEFARQGGLARSKKYDPLKDFVANLVNGRKWNSRRQAAITITSDVIQQSRKINVPLSEYQATTTIYGWLKEMGLPANV